MGHSRVAPLTTPLLVLKLGLVVLAGSAGVACDERAGVCGDGVKDEGEECDDGNRVTEECAIGRRGCRVCSADCATIDGVTHYCGDGWLESWEECDPGGDIRAECPYGTPDCELCGENCVLWPATGPYCGDGEVDAAFGETCDDGNATQETCLYGARTCTVCGATCTEVASTGPYCGDGNPDLDHDEGCDDGNEVDGDGCDMGCIPSGCPNGILAPGEACERGAPCPAGQVCIDCACKDNVCVTPREPVLVGQLRGFETADNLVLANGLVYVAGSNGLHVVDITIPAEPRRLGTVEPEIYGVTEIAVSGLAVAGNYAFTSGYTQVHVFDVSNPTAPVEAGLIGIGHGPGGLAVVGDYLYVAVFDPPDNTGVAIVDITSPEGISPGGAFIAAFYPFWGALVVAASGDLLLAAGGGVDIVDISIPTEPQWVSTFMTSGPVRGIDVVDNIAYLAVFDEGLMLVDVADPADPVEFGTYLSVPEREYVTDVKAAHGRAYIREETPGTAMASVDVSDPTNPQPGEWLFVLDCPCAGDAGAIDGAFGYFINTTWLYVFQVCELPQ